MGKKPVIISMAAAMGSNREIGCNNKLPWHIPEEMALFKRNTIGKTILMGRNTALSMPGRLKHRLNLVLTSHSAPYAGQVTVRSIEDALAFADEELVIIGGAQLYEAAIPLAHKLYLTYINLAVPEADTFFPALNRDDWFATACVQHPANLDRRTPEFTYIEWTRISMREMFSVPDFIPPARSP